MLLSRHGITQHNRHYCWLRPSSPNLGNKGRNMMIVVVILRGFRLIHALMITTELDKGIGCWSGFASGKRCDHIHWNLLNFKYKYKYFFLFLRPDVDKYFPSSLFSGKRNLLLFFREKGDQHIRMVLDQSPLTTWPSITLCYTRPVALFLFKPMPHGIFRTGFISLGKN